MIITNTASDLYSGHSKVPVQAPQGLIRPERLRADSRVTPNARGRQGKGVQKGEEECERRTQETKKIENTKINLRLGKGWQDQEV